MTNIWAQGDWNGMPFVTVRHASQEMSPVGSYDEDKADPVTNKRSFKFEEAVRQEFLANVAITEAYEHDRWVRAQSTGSIAVSAEHDV